MALETFETWRGAKTDVGGDANDGVCAEAQIKQTVGADWEVRSPQA
jgi:hypothetical protein